MVDIGDIGNMMKKVQQMKTDMQQISTELSEEIISTGAGRGAVIAVLSADIMLKSLTIDPKMAPMDDPKKLSELIVFAVNEGIEKAKASGAKKMAKVTGGLNIPGITDMMRK
jgi:DNA-binding YbaB/EbfC family protein